MPERQPLPQPPPAAASAPQDGSRPAARKRPGPRRLGARAALNRAVRLATAEGRQDAVRKAAGRIEAMLINATDRAMREGELTVEGDVKELVGRTIPAYYTMFLNAIRYLDGKGDGDTGDLLAQLTGGRR